jgi:hypothetical protein
MKLKENALEVILQWINDLKTEINIWEKDIYTLTIHPEVIERLNSQIEILNKLIEE